MLIDRDADRVVLTVRSATLGRDALAVPLPVDLAVQLAALLLDALAALR